MSSHHFVKEGQEPALIITGNILNEDILNQLIEWSPEIIVFSAAVEKIVSLGIKIDTLWLKESLTKNLKDLIHRQQPIKIEEATDLEQKIVGYLRQNSLHIIGWGNENSLQFLQNNPVENAVVYSENSRLTTHTGNFEKWLSKGSLVKIYQEAEIKVIRWEENGFLKFNTSGRFILEEILYE